MSDKDDLDNLAEETRMQSVADLAGALDDDTPEQAMAGPAGNIQVEALPADVRPHLLVCSGPRRNDVHAITKPLVLLGRVVGGADILVPDDSASRHHAAIGHRGGTFTLYDLGSTNGTFVDGRRVEQAPLSSGTQIRIGDTFLRFALD